MHAVRDPRFKGSDASNLYDEEIGEEEQEWSDDEAEAEAKRRRKHQRGGSRASATPFSDRSTPAPRLGGAPSLPQRPHFDYQPPESTYAGSETGSLYGGDEGASIYAESDAGSSAGGRGRPMPAPYEVDDTSLPARLIKAEPSSPRQEAGGRGRGRGRGDRGRGDRGRRGGGDFGPRRGGRPNDGGPRQDDRRSSLSNSSRPNSLPPRPMMNPRPEPPFQRQHQQWRPPQPPGSQQPFPRPPQPGFNPHMPMQPYHQNNIPSMPYKHHPFHPQQSPPPHFHPDEQYHPTQPSAGMSFRDTPPMTPPPMVMGQAQPPPQQTCPPPSPGVQAQSPHAPAINPRFAAQYQYQQMLNMGGFSGW